LKLRVIGIVWALTGVSLGLAYAQPKKPTAKTDGAADANAWVQEMRTGRNQVQEQLAEARKERDVVKVLCLSDKLNQLDTAVASGEERAENLQGALARGDGPQAKHEMQMLGAIRERVSGLVSEANQCLGEEMGFLAEPEISVQIDPDIPGDSSGLPNDPTLSVPPVVNSPTF
jgi:hypothetical protein